MWLEVLHRTFRQQSYSNSTANWKKVLFVFIHVLILMQNMNFFWNPMMQIQGWESYSTFWTFLAFPCIDSLAAAFSMISAFTFFTIGSTVFSILSFMISAALIRFNKEIPGIIVFLQKCCIEVVCNIFYIPCTISLVVLIKYSSQDYPYIEEYSTVTPGGLLNYGSVGVIIGVLVLGLLIVLNLIYESCSYDMTYSLENNFYSQSQPYVNICIKLFLFAQCIMMTNFQLQDYEVFIKCDIFLYLIISMLIIYFVPYHCVFTNTVKFWVYADSTVVASAFLIGLLDDSSTLIFAITVFMQPFIGYLSYELVKYRVSRFKQLETDSSAIFSIFEHSARAHLMNEDNDIKVLKSLNKHASFSQNELFNVLCANYCLETLKNSELAQIKIERVQTFTLNLPVMYSIHKCKVTIKRINAVQSKGLKWLNFSQNLESVFEADLKVCNSLMLMYNKLLEPDQKLSNLKSYVLSSNSFIETAIKLYESLLTQFPKCKLVMELYGLFLIDILNNVEQGSTYFDKERKLVKRYRHDKNTAFNKPDECIFIISGNPGDEGRFLYANSIAYDFLKISKVALSTTYIFEFLPSIFQSLHRKYLVNFPGKCLTHTIPCNVFPYLLINNYLVECTSVTECVVSNQKSYFVTFLDPIGYVGREVVLIDLNGIIISHSAGLCAIFELQISHLEGRSINDYLPIHFSDLSPGIPLELVLGFHYSLIEKTVAVVLESNKASGKYFTMYLTAEENEINQWCHQHIGENLEEIGMLHNISSKKVRFSEFLIKVEKELDVIPVTPPTVSASSSHTLENTQEAKALAISLRSLRVIGILIIISVRIIQKLSLIITIIAITVFLYEMSEQLSDLAVVQNLGEIYYTLMVLAIVTRNLDLRIVANITSTFTLSSGYSNLVTLQSEYSLLMNSTQDWHSCPASEITWKDTLPNWRLVNGEPTLYYSNLQDYIGETMRAVIII